MNNSFSKFAEYKNVVLCNLYLSIDAVDIIIYSETYKKDIFST